MLAVAETWANGKSLTWDSLGAPGSARQCPGSVPAVSRQCPGSSVPAVSRQQCPGSVPAAVSRQDSNLRIVPVQTADRPAAAPVALGCGQRCPSVASTKWNITRSGGCQGAD